MKKKSKNLFSRRELLQRTIPAVAGMLALPTIVPASVFGENAPSKRITLGFIGAGIHGLGWNLARFLKLKDAQAVAVCDVVKSRMEAAKKMVDGKYGNKDCKSYSDWRDIISRKDIDAVMISTPDHWHIPMAAAASKGWQRCLL